MNHSSEEIHVGDPQAGDQPRTRTTDSKTPPGTQAALSSDGHNMNYSETYGERGTNRGSLVIGKVLVGAAGAVISVSLAAPAGAGPVPQDFLAAVRAAGITGTDPAILERRLQRVQETVGSAVASGTQVAADLVQDYPQLTIDQAGQFVLAAYQDLCPVPGSATIGHTAPAGNRLACNNNGGPGSGSGSADHASSGAACVGCRSGTSVVCSSAAPSAVRADVSESAARPRLRRVALRRRTSSATPCAARCRCTRPS